MSLRKKTLVSVGITLLALVIMLHGASWLLLVEKLAELEESIVNRNVDRARNTLTNELDQMGHTATDWASWDECLRFIIGENPAFAEANLAEESLTNLGLNFMIFLDTEARVVCTRNVNKDTGHSVPMPPSLLAHLGPTTLLGRSCRERESIDGFLPLAEGPVMLVKRPILQSNSQGPVAGALITGRYLDESELARLSGISRLTVGVWTLDGPNVPPDVTHARGQVAPDRTYTKPLNEEAIAGYTSLKDINGRRSLILRTVMSREVFAYRTRFALFSLFALLFYGAVFGGFTLAALERQVIVRLMNLSRSVSTIAAGGDSASRVAVAGNDELSQLALEINGLLDTVSRSKEKLRQSEATARALLDASGDAAVLFNATGEVLGLNAPAAARFGRAPETVLGMHARDVVPADAFDRRYPYFHDCVKSGKPVNFEDEYAGTLWAHILHPVCDDTGRVVQVAAFSRDVTEARLAVAALRESLQVTSDIVRTIPSGLFTYRFEEPDHLLLVDANPEAERITHLHIDECRNQEFNEIWPEAKTLGITQCFLDVIQSGIPFEAEDLKYSDERINGVYRIRAFRLPGNKLAVAFEDVSGKSCAEQERQRLEEQLHHSQKMEAIGQLAGGVAHDFNNLLSGILGYASLLKLESAPGSSTLEAARTIEMAAERAADLTRQLLGFARRGKFQNIAVNLHDTLQEVIRLLGRTIDKNIRIVQNLRAPSSAVRGDPNQLQQVLLNLAVNARDAMPDGGDLLFESDVVEVEQSFAEVHAGASARTYLVISVTDAGCGISKEHLRRVFEPFFTTKEQGKGTGMGLAMVYGIAKNHGGFVHVYSELGMGATFRVYLPLASEDVAASAPPALHPEPVSGSARILLVDDEEVIRNMGTTVLSRLGYSVATATNGREAVDYYFDHMEEVDLAIIDMVMPEMGGHDCFRALKKINPGVRAILSSGYGFNGKASELLDEGMLGFIQKPYHVAELSVMVSKALNTGRY